MKPEADDGQTKGRTSDAQGVPNLARRGGRVVTSGRGRKGRGEGPPRRRALLELAPGPNGGGVVGVGVGGVDLPD